jgi:S1-C subfamily serine protease
VLAILLAASVALNGATGPSTGAWEATLERVLPAVVMLRLSVPRSFDTERATSSTATGFVVDAEQGLILTNRHVVQPGPVVAEAVFQNHEEVEVFPVYRDPVHDFGFVRYDPSQVRFMPRAELRLAPEQARVGAEVRVVGNDAGEKLVILTGTLARLDREAPEYGRGRYNDFNTFYLQAASNTSGGSSGSPVVNRRGEVVALNAGGAKQSASSFYLPLDRVVRALELLRAGAGVPRGTLQATFVYTPYDELRRLGLRAQTEARARRASRDAIGLLSVRNTVPGGPARDLLEPGDVLVRVGSERFPDFGRLEALLDDHVGEPIELEVERGGRPLVLETQVGDLHEITPDEYLEVGGAVLHALSYQQARSFSVAPSGVFVAAAGYMLSRAEVPRGAVVTALAGEPTPDLDSFERVLANLPDRTRVPLRYLRLNEPHTEQVTVLEVDRRWHPMQRCRRNDALLARSGVAGAGPDGSSEARGRWACVAAASAPPAPQPVPASTRFVERGDRHTRKVARSLVLVEFHVPYRIDGVQGDRFLGAGLVVDAERGLVVTDRDTVPVSLGDATLTFAGSLEVPARVVHLHPAHGLTVLAYDPDLLGDTPVRSADLSDRELEPGDEVRFIGFTPARQVIGEPTHISRIEFPKLPLPPSPRFRETNVELSAITGTTATLGGVLTDGGSKVVALFASFSTQEGRKPTSFLAGIPAELVAEMVVPLREGRLPEWQSLEVEFESISLAAARNQGLPEAAARKLEEHDRERRQVLSVERIVAGSEAARLLQEGDLVLAVNGQPVVRPREVERAVQTSPGGRAGLQVLRGQRELEIEVPVRSLGGRGTERVLVWAGALLQAPPRSLAAQRGIPLEGVYVAWSWFGSPAQRYKLRATRRIVAVDGVATPDLESFVAQVAGKADRDAVRLRTIDLEGRVAVITLKLDLGYWPTVELHRDASGWVREQVETPQAATVSPTRASASDADRSARVRADGTDEVAR